MKDITKAIEISDAKIYFVSLVDKAANNKQFLITKAEDGKVDFTSYGKILKADNETHYITGVVYEPMVEDAHGNFMTEEAIAKAAYWYAKNSEKIDLQHNLKEIDTVSVVESYVAPCEMEIGEEKVLKGSWVMTVAVEDAAIWEAVQKGKITGFSMGGVGAYAEEDVILDALEKSDDQVLPEEQKEKRSLIKRLAAAFGLDVIEKGAVADAYAKRMKASGFWEAFWVLEEVLYHYNRTTDSYEFASDEATVREALSEFSGIITGLLADTSQNITEILASTGLETVNKAKFNAAYDAITKGRDRFAGQENEEEIEVTKQEMEEAIKKALSDAGITKEAELPETEPEGNPEEEEAAAEPVTKAEVAEIVNGMVEEFAKQLEPLYKARNLPSNLNNEQPVEKANDIFKGLFA